VAFFGLDFWRATGQAPGMAAVLTFTDEAPNGTKLRSFTLESLAERMTAREIIRARIYQEVQDFNRTQADTFRGLVEPGDAERTLNGAKMKKHRALDWEKQFSEALRAFESNGFFMLVGNRQAEQLDEMFDVKIDTEVTFVKLVPLVGG
jgi:hypothetical protein